MVPTPWSEIKLLVLDKDGTLVDFYPTWTPLYFGVLRHLSGGDAQCFAALLAVSGFSAEGQLAADSPLVHATPTQILACWQQVLPTMTLAQLQQQTDAFFAQHYLQTLRPPCPLPSLLQAVQARGVKVALLTSDSQYFAEQAVQALQISPWVDWALGSDQGLAAKPDVAMLAQVAQQAQVEPYQVAVVGDHPRDLQMAKTFAAGRAVGVLTGPSRTAELLPWADEIWPQLGYLAERLLSPA
ncbi:HAD family hydrolase [Balneatrix alpica]|uniref:phosphoglycolate phosphatase n=1 Tax=Balneatrix alpica TaxID=75684 RepID=A0ABV5ZDW2_9GAMM|nr:HAD family hydrolase [Balneatrix alpica]